jgi:hypothetical protein
VPFGSLPRMQCSDLLGDAQEVTGDYGILTIVLNPGYHNLYVDDIRSSYGKQWKHSMSTSFSTHSVLDDRYGIRSVTFTNIEDFNTNALIWSGSRFSTGK